MRIKEIKSDEEIVLAYPAIKDLVDQPYKVTLQSCQINHNSRFMMYWTNPRCILKSGNNLEMEIGTTYFSQTSRHSIGIFPEGGSHDRPELLPLKAGVTLMALVCFRSQSFLT